MNWAKVRAFLRPQDAPSAPERLVGAGPVASSPFVVADSCAGALCIASGKGGTGKSVVTASLARLLARRGTTLIVDADLGVGNAHILQDAEPERSLVDVVDGRASVRDVVQQCGPNIHLLAAGCGVVGMSELSPLELRLIAAGLREIERAYAWMLVDSAAGISAQTLNFAQASDLVLLVTTPDLTALTDAYAFYKVLLTRQPDARAWLLVNRASSAEEALSAAGRVERVALRFLGAAPVFAGWLPEDKGVQRAVNHRRPAVSEEPESPFARALIGLCERLQQELSLGERDGLGSRMLALPSERVGRR